MRRAALLAGALTLFYAHTSWAVITNVDSASDVCSNASDPCVISDTVEVVDGATLDFGSRALQLQGGGMIDVQSGAATIKSGRLLVNVSGTAFSLVGPSPFGGTAGGLIIIEVTKRCSGNTSIACLRSSTCAAQSAGTCTAGNVGDVSLKGRVVGTSDSPGEFLIRAAGNVGILSPIHLDGTTVDSDGGTVEIDSSGTLTVSATITATAGALSGGGEVCLLGDVDTIVNDTLDVTGGDFDGGIVEVSAKRDVVMTADVGANSAAGGGFGGEIDLDAGRDLTLNGGSGSNRQVLSADGHTSFDNFAGDGGTHEYFATRNLTIGQFVRATSNGSGPDGYGDFMFITANGNAVISGELRANPLGVQGGGGEIEVLAFGNIQVTSTAKIDVTGSGGGGGDATVSADGQLDFDGTADASAGNGGTSGSLELDGGQQLFVRGQLAIGGTKIRTFAGTVIIDACRINLMSGSKIDDSAEGGLNRLTARERVTINSGATMLADGVGGINRIIYRSPAKPPIINGTVTPAPELVVNSNLPGCPLCGNNEVDGGETCDDGNHAGGDGCSATCQDEGCVAQTPGYPSVALCSDGDACTVDTCNTTTHTCGHVASCDDGIACTADSCQGTACTHTANDALCDDGNPCATGVCNTASGCTYVPQSGPCNDGLFCTGVDRCAGGTCSDHSGDPCDGSVECRDLCDEDRNSCISPAGTPCTADSNVCTSDYCNGSGQCIHPLSSSSCDDGLFCNGSDVCSGGTCSVHLGNPCTALGECSDTCDETGNACQTPSGTACADDNNMCTTDACDGAGGCAHAAGAVFSLNRLTVTRIGGPSNDRATMKATFPLAALTASPSDTGFTLDVLDANHNLIYRSIIPAGALVDTDGRIFRYSSRSTPAPQGNGLSSALIKRDTAHGLVRVKVRVRDYDLPGVVGTPSVAVAMLFGQDAGTDDCITATTLPCTARGSKVICGN
jgi:cysteine-rich repeat protein